MFEKPFSQSCENNKQPILAALTGLLADSHYLFEIGSGTGQHASHFAPKLAHLTWQTSDMPDKHKGINAWIDDSGASNIRPPKHFTVGLDAWPADKVDAVYTANTTHIMPAQEAQLMMELVGEHLPTGGIFCQYGPFNSQGQYSSASNQSFDLHLIEQGCGGIRDIQELQSWTQQLTLTQQLKMPANNMLLVWQKY
jgi:hypothetical protein